LNNITLPPNITSIGLGLFYGCSSLTSITLSENITSIGDSAFLSCPNLNTVIIQNPSSIGTVYTNSFTNVSGNPSSNITFDNTANFNALSPTFQTIANYYAIQHYESSTTTPTLTDFSFNTQIYGVAPFTIRPPISNSDGSFSYESLDETVAIITNEDIINIVGVGIAIIQATQDASGNYSEGMIDASFNVIEATPNNPAEINSGSGLGYFLETTSEYGNITNTTLTISGQLLTQSSKTITTTDATNIIIN
jgi:hypothetical protein